MSRYLTLVFALSLVGCIAEAPPSRVGGEIAVDREPPVERVEVPPPPPPSERLVWIRGHWYWNGRGWLWVGGHYAPMRPGFRYVHGHWERRGPVWVWVEGGWRAG